MVTSNDLYWLAGILEGEGSFQWSGSGRSLCIALGMNDCDVVDRAAATLGGLPGKVYMRTITGNLHYRTHVYGYKAAGWMMTLYTLLGIRRRAKIRELLAEWRQRPGLHGKRKKVPRGRNKAGRFISSLC